MSDVDGDAPEDWSGPEEEERSDEKTSRPSEPAQRGLPIGDVAAIWTDMKTRSAQGEPVRVEDYLPEAYWAECPDELLLDLVYAEFLLRGERAESPTIDEYVDRFPHLADQIRRQFAIHWCLASWAEAGGKDPSTDLSAIRDYRVSRRVHSDDCVTIYRSIHPFLGREVWIILGRRSIPEDSRRWFEAEGRKLIQAEHPHLAQVLDIGVIAAGQPFLVVEDVGACDLPAYAAEHRLTSHQIAALVAKVARAVAAIHRAGTVHGAVVPESVRVDLRGQPYLMGFGLLHRLLRSHQPEASAGKRDNPSGVQTQGVARETGASDEQEDIFGLGRVLYFLLTGQHLPSEGSAPRAGFTRSRPHEPIETEVSAAPEGIETGPQPTERTHGRESVVDDSLKRRGVPRGLRAICQRCLAAESGGRYPHAERVAEELEHFLRCGRVARGIWAVLALSVVVGVAIAWLGRLREQPMGSPEKSAPATDQRRATAPSIVSPVTILVQIGSGDFFNEVEDALPITTGERLRVAVGVLPDVHAALFRVDVSGKLTVLAQTDSKPGGTVLRYPADKKAAAEIEGRPGTELFFVCGRRSATVDVKEVARLWNGRPLPKLPDDCVIRVTAVSGQSEPVLENSPGAARTSTPQAAVRDRIRRFGQRLQHAGYEFFGAIAFSHQRHRP